MATSDGLNPREARLTHRRSSTFSGPTLKAIASGSGPITGSPSGDSLSAEEPPWASTESPKKRILPLRTLSIDDEDDAHRLTGYERGSLKDPNDPATSVSRARSGSLLMGGMGGRERPSISSVGLRLAGLRASNDIPSPPNTNSDAGSGPGSVGRKNGAGLVRRKEGVLTPESSERAGSSNASAGRGVNVGTLSRPEPRRTGSDVGSQRSGSIRRSPLTTRPRTGGSIDDRSQGSGSGTSRAGASPRRPSQQLLRAESKSSSSSRSPVAPASPLAGSSSSRVSSPVEASPAKTVVATRSPGISRVSSLRRGKTSTLSQSGTTDILRSSSMTVRPKRSTSESTQSSDGLGTGRIKVKAKAKQSSGDDDRPVISRSKRNERLLASINATLASPPESPSKEKTRAKEPSPTVDITPPSSFLEPPGSRGSTSSSVEGGMPFAQGRSPAPRKVGEEAAAKRQSIVNNVDQGAWDGSVRRLAPPRPNFSGADAFAAAETIEDLHVKPKGSMRRIGEIAPSPKEEAVTAKEEEARRRVEDWSAATEEAKAAESLRTPSSSIRGMHRRQLSETMTSSSGTARNPNHSDSNNEDDDAETTPGKSMRRTASISSRSIRSLRRSESVDEFGSVSGRSGRHNRNHHSAADGGSGRSDWGSTWSSGERKNGHGGERSHTSLSRYSSTISYSRSSTNRPVSRAATVYGSGSGESRNYSTARRHRAQGDGAPPLPNTTGSARKSRPGLPEDFLNASRDGQSPRLRDRPHDSKSTGSGSAGRPFPSMSNGVHAADSKSDGSRASNYKRSIRLSDITANRLNRLSASPRTAAEAAARLRHTSLTDGMARSQSNLADVFQAADRVRGRARSSLSPSTLSFSQSVSGRVSRQGSNRIGGKDWWDDVDDLRGRINQIKVAKPESEVSGPSHSSSDGRRRHDVPATPNNQRPERERTLRGVQTAPGPSHNGFHADTDSVVLGAPRPRTIASTSRFGLNHESPRTPLSTQLGRMSSMSRARPGSSNSNPFSPTPDVETHQLLQQAYEALERHFAASDGEESVALVNRMVSVIRSTCRLNSELHLLATSMQDAQVELQIDDARSSTSSLALLSALDRTAQRSSTMSDNQVRDLTEALLALPRADRERSQMQEDGVLGFRPASRAGTSSRAGSPVKSESPADLYSTGNRPLRNAKTTIFDDSPSVGHRRGGSEILSRGVRGAGPFATRHRTLLTSHAEVNGAEALVPMPKSPSGLPPQETSSRGLADETRTAKGSATSLVSAATNTTLKRTPSQFPRSPARPSPKVSEEHAEAGQSPTKRRGSSQTDRASREGLGLVYSGRGDASSNWRQREGSLDPDEDGYIPAEPQNFADRSPQVSPKRRSLAIRPSTAAAIESEAAPQQHRRRLSNAAAALERIGSLTSRTFGRTSRRSGSGSDGAAAAMQPPAAAPANGTRQKEREGEEVEALRRSDRQDRVNDILLRRSASRAGMLDNDD